MSEIFNGLFWDIWTQVSDSLGIKSPDSMHLIYSINDHQFKDFSTVTDLEDLNRTSKPKTVLLNQSSEQTLLPSKSKLWGLQKQGWEWKPDWFISIENKVWTPQSHDLTGNLTIFSSDGRESACNEGDLGSVPVLGRFLGEWIPTHSSILSWRISWTEEPGSLPSMDLQRVRHDWATNTFF